MIEEGVISARVRKYNTHLHRHVSIRTTLAAAATSITTAHWLLEDQRGLDDQGVARVACDELAGFDSPTREEPLCDRS